MHFVHKEEDFLIRYYWTTWFTQRGVPRLCGLILTNTNVTVVTHHYTAQGRSFSLAHYYQ